LTMGVEGWQSFTEALHLLVDRPELVHAIMDIQAEFAACLAERILRDVQVDGVLFSEPIAGNSGPLISPAMYQAFVLQSYEPLLDVAERYQVQNIILRTYANPRPLLKAVFQSRFNCLWACECNSESMDYHRLRAELGSRIRLIGGIDSDVLRQDKRSIRREVEEKLPPLLGQGGFIPLADGRVRDDVPLENYIFYRRLLEEIVRA
jgi:uroporphyrinogen-III decarboxylase